MLEMLGKKIDACEDSNNIQGLREVIKECYAFIEQNIDSATEIPICYFFISNAYSAIKKINEINAEYSPWTWDDNERGNILLNLRKSMSHKNFINIDPIRQCQIFTNTGNLLSNTGRTISAVQYFRKARMLNKYFSMAIFNEALSLETLAGLLYDDGHKYLTFNEAYKLYKLIYNKEYYSQIEDSRFRDINNRAVQFCNWWESIKEKSLVNLRMYHDDISKYVVKLGKTKSEVEYKQWCLVNTLFINPLNDLGEYSLAANDVFILPDMIVKIGDGPYYHSFMQQIKQEYMSARFMCYQGIKNIDKKHYSDSTIDHIDTLDYPIYGLWLEMIKCSFKTCYGILDKIGIFLNEYYSLGISKIYFRYLWYNNQKLEKGLKRIFHNKENLPLRGLFWLSKDLMGELKDINYPDNYLEPEARFIVSARNIMEHGYMRVVLFEGVPPVWEGDFAESISCDKLVNMTMYILSFVREAIIYLGLSVYIEERSRKVNGKYIAEYVPQLKKK